MSTLKVEVVPILDIQPHPNADLLELAAVKGWSCIVKKGAYAIGDRVVYIPVDSVLPIELSDRLNVTKYLSNGRVRAAKLRGVVSYGLIIENEGDWAEGTDVREEYKITKFEPPIQHSAGDAVATHPALVFYTNIENFKNYPDLFFQDEEVVVTEKIHGTNCIHGLVVEDGQEIFLASSHRVQRREDPASVYWKTFTDVTRNLLREAIQGHHCALLYKEVYGGKIQNLNYGSPSAIADVTFDLSLDGRYVDYDDLKALCQRYGLPMAPLLYRGGFDKARLDGLINGPEVKTTLGRGKHILEGVVIKPAKERFNLTTRRTILKWISDAYALDTKATDFH